MESGASQCAKNEDGHIFNHGKSVEYDVKVMLPYYRSYELVVGLGSYRLRGRVVKAKL